MYICLKSKHVTQSSLCTAKVFILFRHWIYIFTYFHSFLCLLIYSISIDFIFHSMSTNVFLLTAPSYSPPSVSCWYLVRLLSLERRSCLCSKQKQSWLWFSFFFLFFLLPIHSNSSSPPTPKKCTVLSFKFTVFWSSSVSFCHDIIRVRPLGSSSVTGVVEVEWLQWIPMTLWFKHTPPCDHTIGEEGKKKKYRDCSASGFHRFPREITEPQQVMSSDSGSYCLRLGSVLSRPLEVTCWVCESCFSLWLVSGCIVGGVIIVFCSRCYWNKALERFLVFTVAQRRPGRGRSSGAGEARCGRPWDSRVSAPVRSPRRCLWWTDGPCSSWLL